MSDNNQQWQDQNRLYIERRLEIIRQFMIGKITGEEEDNNDSDQTDDTVYALDILSQTFGLSQFEENIILLCAGMELEGDFPKLCKPIHGESKMAYPTFGMTMEVFPNPHWSAFTDDAPLRKWRIIKTEQETNISHSPIFIDDSVLHFVLGISQMVPEIKRLVEYIPFTEQLPTSHQDLADNISDLLEQAVAAGKTTPVIQIRGNDFQDIRNFAAAVCDKLNLGLYVIPLSMVPNDIKDLDILVRLWTRDAALNFNVIMIECTDSLLDFSSSQRSALSYMIEKLKGMVFISTQKLLDIDCRSNSAFDFDRPEVLEQIDIWQELLDEQLQDIAEKMNPYLIRLVSQFNMSRSAILGTCLVAKAYILNCEDAADPDYVFNILWDACRRYSKPTLDQIAEHIDSDMTFDDLVLPDPQKDALNYIISNMKYRDKVYMDWNFLSKTSRGIGVNVLFTGVSGTGKTMAAEVIANELGLDLYRIDLSSVVSKYIGETEKQLRKVFDAADQSGIILLFDEADALFGKRTEVKDSHDRHANIEVSYLLQRIESYNGLAILTTNLRDSVDEAFLRRLRFIIDFPFPNAAQRESIWERTFPESTPLENVDFEKLSQLNVTGGSIKNIALNAAFIAATEDSSIKMEHLLKATKAEYMKMEKVLTDLEIEGWV